MRRLLSLSLMTLAFGAVAAQPASAQQSLNLYVGGFVPRAQDARDPNDVLLNNLNFLAFNIKDFNTATIGGEWLIGLGNNFEGSLGVGFHTRTVPTVYLNFVNTDGSEIQQDLKLRVVPFTATVRFLPIGRHNGIEPYIGAGVGVFNYRYSESGQFLATDQTIFRNTFVGSGTATGPVILAGVRVPVGSWGVGGEIRYQSAKGNLPANQDFAGSVIDLGGFNYLFTINVRF
jgi:outer membrane protein W